MNAYVCTHKNTSNFLKSHLSDKENIKLRTERERERSQTIKNTTKPSEEFITINLGAVSIKL